MPDDITAGEETTLPEAAASELDTAQEPIEQLEGQTEGTEPEEEFDEFEWEGKQVKGPKGLKDGVLRYSDYTQKTQEVAAQRQELETKAQALDQQLRAHEEELHVRATLVSIDEQLKAYANVDWDRFEQEDFVTAQQQWRRFQTLQSQRQGVIDELAGRQQYRSVEAQRDFARRMQETEAFATKEIPGWKGRETLNEVVGFLNKHGVNDQTLKDVISPQVLKIAHLAMLGEKALTKPAPKPAAPSGASKPLTVVGGKATPGSSKSLADMDMDEYVAARTAGRG